MSTNGSEFKPCLNGFTPSAAEEQPAQAVPGVRVSEVTPPPGATTDNSDDVKARGLSPLGVLWKKDAVTVSFFQPVPIAGLIDAIKRIAVQWTVNTSIKFKFLDGFNQPADIRVKFTESNSYWSMIGTNSSAASTSGASMNLGFDLATFNRHDELERLILHEFGHALGFAHEHQNEELKVDMPAAVAYFRRNGLSHLSDQAIAQQFKKLKAEEIDPRSSKYDVDSVMLYSFPPEVATPTKHNTKLSPIDKETIEKLYGSEKVFAKARAGMELTVEDASTPKPIVRTAYYLFGKDVAQFYFLARSAGNYEIHLTSETSKDVVDPYADIPLFFTSSEVDSSGEPSKKRSIVDVALFNDFLLDGASVEVCSEVDKETAPKPGPALADGSFTIEPPDDPESQPFETSKVIKIEKIGYYYIKARISEPKGDEPCRFVLSVRKKS